MFHTFLLLLFCWRWLALAGVLLCNVMLLRDSPGTGTLINRCLLLLLKWTSSIVVFTLAILQLFEGRARWGNSYQFHRITEKLCLYRPPGSDIIVVNIIMLTFILLTIQGCTYINSLTQQDNCKRKCIIDVNCRRFKFKHSMVEIWRRILNHFLQFKYMFRTSNIVM